MTDFLIRPATPVDMAWAKQMWTEHWASHFIVSRGVLHDATQLPAFVAIQADQYAGIATYNIVGSSCELVTLDSLIEGIGVGGGLIDAVRGAAREAGCTRVWLITSNDNTHALRFYQKRGFRLAALHVNAIAQSRKLKPEIPFIGDDGIPIRDEIELEIDP